MGLLILISCSFCVGSSYAATYQVTNTNDQGPGSLRQAISESNSNPEDDVIEVLVRCNSTITLRTGELVILGNGKLSIIGPNTISTNNYFCVSISGNDSSRIFRLEPGSDVEITGLALNRGKARDYLDCSQNCGGAIFTSKSSILSIKRTIIYSNSAYSGGGIFSNGTLLLEDTVVSFNDAVSDGGGVYATGNLHAKRVLFQRNTSFGFGGRGGALFNNSVAEVIESRFSDNESFSREGNNILNAFVLDLTNSTLEGRVSDEGSNFQNERLATLTNVTINNDNGSVGIRNIGIMDLNNSIVANSALADCENSNILNASHSLIEDGLECLNGPVNENNLTGDPRFGPVVRDRRIELSELRLLAFSLAPDSPAIDAGNNGLIPDGVVFDQRGAPRILNGTVDLGAFESGDEDFDGVLDSEDACLETVLPDTDFAILPENRYGTNSEGEFVSSDGTLLGIDLEDTAGCSSSQIIEASRLGKGIQNYGVTRGILRSWIANLPR